MQMLSHLILPQNYEFSSQFFTWKTLWNCHNKVKDLWWIFCRSGFLFEDMLGRHQRKSSIEPFKFLLVLKYSSVYSFRFFKKEVALHIHHLKSGYSCNIRKWPYPEPFPRIIRVWRKKQYISYSSFSFEKKVCLWDTKKEQNKSISSLQPIWQNILTFFTGFLNKYPFSAIITFPFSCFILSSSLCCSLILANNSCSLRRISAWSRLFSSSRSRMDFCCCKNVLFPADEAEGPDAVSLLFTRSFSSEPNGERPGDLLGERLVRFPGLLLFLQEKISRFHF